MSERPQRLDSPAGRTDMLAPSMGRVGTAVPVPYECHPRVVAGLRAFSMVAGVAAILVGALVFVGWALDVDVLKSLIPGFKSMNPVSAVTFAVFGFAMWLLRSEAGPARVRRAAWFCATLVAGVAVLKLASLCGFGPRVDQLLFADKLEAVSPPNRMSPNTAVSFLLLSLALVLLEVRTRRGASPSQGLSLVAGLIGMLGLAGYLYGSRQLYGLPGQVMISLPSALMFITISLGVLCARPDRGLMQIVSSAGVGGTSVRFLLLAAITLPLLLGWLKLLGERAGLYQHEFGMAMVAVAMVVVFSALVGFMGRFLDAADQLRRRTEANEALRLEEARKEALLGLNQITDAPLQQITAGAVEHAVALTGSRVGYLAFLNEDETVLTMQSWSKMAGAQREVVDKPLVVPVVDTGLWGEAVRQRQAVITNDYVAPNPSQQDFPEGLVPVLRHVNVPVFDGQRIVLVAGVGNKEEPYGEADVRQLTLLMQGLWQLVQRRQAAEELARYNQQLQAANQELEAFSYSVSHDLRTPLRALDGFSLALVEDFGDRLNDVAKGYLTRIRAASQRMGALIDDLLKLSRLTRQEMKRQAVDLSRLAHVVQQELRSIEPARQVEFVFEDGLLTEGDERLLRAVLQQLLENAWKFTSRQPTARIEFGRTTVDQRPAFFVRDNGVGFDMTYADKLFGPFQRLHAAEEFPGTGIGLATVHRIIQRHGGRIWADAALGKGATFYFTL